MAATATTLWRGQICRSCTQLVELDLSYLKLGDSAAVAASRLVYTAP
jgi:hypothetical protein